MQLYPAQIIIIFENDEKIQSEFILEELQHPIHDLIEIDKIIHIVQKVRSDSNFKTRIISSLKEISK